MDFMTSDENQSQATSPNSQDTPISPDSPSSEVVPMDAASTLVANRLDKENWNKSYYNMLAKTRSVTESILDVAVAHKGCTPTDLKSLLDCMGKLDNQIRRAYLGERSNGKRTVHVNINTTLEEIKNSGLSKGVLDVKAAQFFQDVTKETFDE